jgi:hypothetical protein
MVDFEFDPEYVPGVKLGLHTFQILCAFVAWCLEIAVFRDDKAEIVGNNGWTFAGVRLPRGGGTRNRRHSASLPRATTGQC